MIRSIITLFLTLISIIGFSQTNDVFRMVGNGTWSVVNDSTYSATVVFQADLTGKGYLANQITTSYRLFSPIGAVYRISNVSGSTFSQATLTIVELVEATAAPTGQVMVYNPDGRETVPQNPFGSTGSTAQLQAAIDTWNSTLIGGAFSQTFTVAGDAIEAQGDTIHIGGPMDSNRQIDATGDTLVFKGVGGLFHVDSSATAKFQSLQLQRKINSTGDLIIDMTIATTVTLPNLPDGSVKYVSNNSVGTVELEGADPSTIGGVDSILIEPGGSAFVVYNSSQDNWDIISTGGTTTSPTSTLEVDSLVNGTVTAWVSRNGGSLTTMTNPGAGIYTFTLGGNAEYDRLSIQGNNANLNGSNEMVININNSPHGRSHRYMVQLYDANNGALVDQQVTGTNHIQTVSGVITTLTIPGLNGFGATGYIIEIE